MKRLSLIFIFVVFLITTLLLSSCQSRTTAPIRDTDGNVLRYGTNYYIVPTMHGMGGGLILARGQGQICPQEVAQSISDVSDGDPLNFIPANKDDKIISESVDLNIKFVDAVTCAPNKVWQVFNYYNQRRMLYSQGVVGKPGKETIDNWFKIEKYEDHYKIVYCPSVCSTCKPFCSDVGTFLGERGRRSLVLNNKPLKVKFKKA